jgi:methylenetetrahydrofolate reductase (NADPH)
VTVAEALVRPRYELIPLAGIEETVLEHVPREVTLTVTTSPKKGLEPTLALAERFRRHGYAVVPHLAARHVVDTAHLAEIAARMRAAGVDDVLVMAGDAEEPAGDFEGALPFLQALDDLGRPFAEVGITGYPESRPGVSDAATDAATAEKGRFATYVVSQVCFAPDVTAAWLRRIWQQGMRLPVHVGLPGPVDTARLLRVCERIGVGESIEVPRAGPFDESAVFDPTPLAAGLDASPEAHPSLAGVHVFTFNEVAATEAWRSAYVASTAAPPSS